MVGNSVLASKIREIAKAESDSRSVVEGFILDYSIEDHLATVELTSINGSHTVERVPVCIPYYGLHGQLPKVGDVALMVSAKGRSEDIRIIGIMDKMGEISDYTLSRKYKQRGETLIDLKSIGESNNPRYNRRIKSSPFHSRLTAFINVDTIEQYIANTSKLSSAYLNDVALMNPVSKAMVKVGESGMIDIFTLDDTGIRVDPINKRISFFGNVETKSKEWSVLSNSIKIESKEINVSTDSLKINGREMLDV